MKNVKQSYISKRYSQIEAKILNKHCRQTYSFYLFIIIMEICRCSVTGISLNEFRF